MGKAWTGNHRAPWHDYTKRQIYHITLKKRPEIVPFGSLGGDWRLPRGSYGRSYIQASSLGSIIKACLRDIKSIHPGLRIYQYALMPDHLHLLLSVEEELDEIVGRKIAAFKVMVNKISPAGKEIRSEAETLGSKIILLTHEAFPERFKPASRDFALCAEGRLLIITLGYPPGTGLIRSVCLQMNTLAEMICKEF